MRYTKLINKLMFISILLLTPSCTSSLPEYMIYACSNSKELSEEKELELYEVIKASDYILTESSQQAKDAIKSISKNEKILNLNNLILFSVRNPSGQLVIIGRNTTYGDEVLKLSIFLSNTKSADETLVDKLIKSLASDEDLRLYSIENGHQFSGCKQSTIEPLNSRIQ